MTIASITTAESTNLYISSAPYPFGFLCDAVHQSSLVRNRGLDLFHDHKTGGAFLFEPHSYDHVNQASHEHKEEIKVGYNLKRKVVLLSIWALLPMAIYFNAGFLGILPEHNDWLSYIEAVGTAWLYLGIAAVLFREFSCSSNKISRLDLFG